MLQAHNHAYVMPIVRWGKTSRFASIEPTNLTHPSPPDFHRRLPTRHAGRTPQSIYRETRYHYAKRFGIEAIPIRHRDDIDTRSVRLLYVGEPAVAERLAVSTLEYVATPRGGRVAWSVVVQGVHQHDPMAWTASRC
ncbi:hypothetical protein D8S78_19910, partial [Natrialba swarupiae]|nr:hypothetical protein [Natrialba swarupiae]